MAIYLSLVIKLPIFQRSWEVNGHRDVVGPFQKRILMRNVGDKVERHIVEFKKIAERVDSGDDGSGSQRDEGWATCHPRLKSTNKPT
jgi:hypothetical protein